MSFGASSQLEAFLSYARKTDFTQSLNSTFDFNSYYAPQYHVVYHFSEATVKYEWKSVKSLK